MAEVFFYRSYAVKAAKDRGLIAFETYKPVPEIDPRCWTYEERPDGPGIQYAKEYAKGKDWIHHVEVTEAKVPVLVVTCTREELPTDIPAIFELRPMVHEIWEAERRYYPKPSVVATGQALGRASRAAPKDKPVIQDFAGVPPVPVAKREKSTGESPVKTVWRICAEMIGQDRKAVIAACVDAGVHPGTAATQYSKWKRETQGTKNPA